MSSDDVYNPDSGALNSGVDFLQLLIPLDYVTAPGVSLTSACFAHLVYDHNAAAKCFSNILAVGFKRIELDVYWDTTLELWSFCPVQLGDATARPSTQADSATQAPTLISSLSLDTSNTSGDLQPRPRTIEVQEADRRQEPTSTTGYVSITASATSPSSLSSSLEAVSDVASTDSSSTSTPTVSYQTSSDDTLQVLGSYSCTKSTDLDLFMSVLSGNLGSTQRDLNATMKYLVFNLHAASPAVNSSGPANQPVGDLLPRGSNLLGQILLEKTSAYLYTPSQLGLQRADLNSSGPPSWFAVAGANQPDSAYFLLNHTGNGNTGDLSTINGWPGEGYVEQSSFKRLLAAFGQIDPQMSGYNFTADNGDIFGPGYIMNELSITYNSEGNITDGCFYQPGMQILGASTNSSWAVDGISTKLSVDGVYALASSLTSCGISPILNQTLSNITADQDYQLYKAFIDSTSWVWQSGQPSNTSNDADKDRRCAALNSSNFRLQQEDCSDEHFAACRVQGLPYSWQISGSQASYINADRECGDNTSFSVPRTALESTYLGHAWQAYRSGQTSGRDDDTMDELLWVDFNDLDVEFCWVIGQNTTCPYIEDGETQTQKIVVPVVAAIIVFVLTLLTIFVKCAGNRRISKAKRKRGSNGWDYEGVPS
nr:maintenance of telomere capping protein 6 [Quercus suber]POE94766.1 maintenance of telomere capping protein 6 [Quercus suber]